MAVVPIVGNRELIGCRVEPEGVVVKAYFDVVIVFLDVDFICRFKHTNRTNYRSDTVSFDITLSLLRFYTYSDSLLILYVGGSNNSTANGLLPRVLDRPAASKIKLLTVM